MLTNYLKIALRGMIRHKGYSFINIAGLALGLACCVLILLYVEDELSFDAFHTNADRIYRLVETRTSPDRGERQFPSTMGPVGPALVSAFPEIVKEVRFRSKIGIGRMAVTRGNERFYIGDEMVVEPDFFGIFDFKFMRGAPEEALKNPNSVVLTESSAHRFFGEQDPVGQTLKTDRFGELRVTAVLQDPPPNSHLAFSMLVSFATLTANPRWEEFINSWNSSNFITYILARNPLDVTAFNAKLADFVERHQGAMPKTLLRLEVQPLRDIHFGSGNMEFDTNENKGEMTYVYVVSVIALFIVIIACINYMNLATARAMKRSKEIAIRKVVGGQRRQLVGQFLGEAFLLTAIAFALALVLTEIALPFFNDLAAKQLSLGRSLTSGLLPGLIALVVVVGLVSGSYPALYLARLRPVIALKGERMTGSFGPRLRQGLVVAQFALSIVMMVSTVVAYPQMQYVRTKHLGFNKDQLVVIDINSGGTRRNFQTIKTAIASLPSVSGVTVSSRVPGDWKSIDQISAVGHGAPESETHTMFFLCIDQDFLPTFQMELAAGRNLSGEMGTDTAAVLINETAARTFGWDDPLGKGIRVPGANYQAHVVGVVKDFSFESLHERIAPMVLGHTYNPVTAIDYFTVRVRSEGMEGTIAELKKIHEQFDQTTPFEYNFLDDRLNDFYRTDVRMEQIFGLSAGLTIVIACLGLFGLAAFSAEQRTKEIGIRKVLGASEGQIVFLLSKDFSKLVVFATVIASPIAYYLVERWLEVFAFRISVGWLTFAAVGLGAILIALLTVAYQAVRSALANPVEALRFE